MNAHEIPVMNSAERAIKFIKDLTAAVILQLMAIGLTYVLVSEIRPAVALIEPMKLALTTHEINQAEFYRQHLALMQENTRLARIQCVTYQESLKRPTAICQGDR